MILLLAAGLLADPAAGLPENQSIGEWQKFMATTSLPAFTADESGDAATGTTVRAKNPKLAFLMSAVVPGSGQVYAKSYIKAAAFFGIEVAAWALNFSYKDDGKRIEDEFHAYANTHWSEEEYWKWIAHQAGLEYDPNNLEPLREWEGSKFSHGLHREKDQQYYEMIGKYHQFSWGWDDFREDNDISITDEEITERYNADKSTINDRRYFYETRRNASNDAFQKATTAATVAVVNHILSAVDAAWTTTKFNRRVQVGLQFEPIRYNYETYAALTLRANW